MTVKELRELLKKYPDDILVVVSGYESGWDDITPGSLSKKEVLLNCKAHSYDGQHEELYFAKKEAIKKGKTAKVLAFARSSN